MMQERPDRDLDEATAGRLARLRTLPVDTARLDARLARLIPNPGHARSGRRAWFGPLRIAAAGLIAFGLLAAVVIGIAGRPVLASAAQLAEIHHMVVSGPGHPDVLPVTSMQEAEQVLGSRWSRMPDLPDMPEGHVMACCLHTIGRKRIGAVGLTAGDVPVTLAVANAGDARLPGSEPVVVDGHRYWAQSSQNVNMVLTQRNGRWICLMGETSIEQLIELAQALRF